MITFKFQGKEYPIKNQTNEISLSEFSLINSVITDEKFDNTEKWINILGLLELPEEVIDNLSIDELGIYIKNAFNERIDNTYIESITIDGYEYIVKLDDGKPFIGITDLKWIEKMLPKGPEYMVGVLFKRSDLTKKEHYDKSHILHKGKLIGNTLTAEQALPYIIHINSAINNAFKSFIKNDENPVSTNN
jgi:hypothetical protein